MPGRSRGNNRSQAQERRKRFPEVRVAVALCCEPMASASSATMKTGSLTASVSVWTGHPKYLRFLTLTRTATHTLAVETLRQLSGALMTK